MRENLTPEIISAVGGPTITTALAARLEFASETVFVWTGIGSIQPMSSGDSLLDGNTFDQLAEGVVTAVGENSFSYSGSEEFTITLGVPSQPSVVIASASIYPIEYWTRAATIWRAIKLPQIDPLAAPIWVFRRIRSGKMDKVEILNDGNSHTFTLTIESHQANISNASNQTYLNQRTYDPTDSSQDYAVSIANGSPAPTYSNSLTSGASYAYNKTGNGDYDPIV